MTISILFIPSSFANSFLVIDDGGSGRYQYTVIKKEDTFTWEIGYEDKVLTIEETEDNTEVLMAFRGAVKDMNANLLKIIISISYCLVVLMIALIMYVKNKQMLKRGYGFIAIFAGIAVYTIFLSFFELKSSLGAVEYFYSVLTLVTP